MPAAISESRPSHVPFLKDTERALSADALSPIPGSSYPPSSPSDDSDANTPSNDNLRLYASIATVPERRLREIMVKLADSSPGFQHAIANELLPPAITVATPQRKRRSMLSTEMGGVQRTCANCGRRIRHDRPHEKCRFHPGRLEDEVYEFLSRTPEGRSSQVVRTITMWSCCDEDARSVGCVVSPSHVDWDRVVLEA